MAFNNIRKAALVVDVDTQDLVTSLANLPAGLNSELTLIFVSAGVRQDNFDPATVKLELYLPNDIARSAPLPASIQTGEFNLNTQSKQYNALLDMRTGIMSYLNVPILYGRITAGGFQSNEFHVLVQSRAQSQLPVRYYATADAAAASLINQIEAANTVVLGRHTDTYTVALGDDVIERDIPATYTGEMISGGPVIKAAPSYAGTTYSIKEWKVDPALGSNGRVVITLSSKIKAAAAGQYTIITKYEKLTP